MRVAEVLDDFVDDCELRGMSPSTIERYISSVNEYGRFLDEQSKDISSADNGVLRRFLDYLRRGRGLSLRTIEADFAAISCLYSYLEYQGHVNQNPILAVRKRYLRRFKDNGPTNMRKLISVEDMARMINSTVDVRDRAILSLLAKTGIRRKELIAIDIEDVDWIEQSITLKPTPKRTNRIVFFDDETAFILRRWIRVREGLESKSQALFLNHKGDRLARHGMSLSRNYK